MNRIPRLASLLLLVTTSALSAETLSLVTCIERALAQNIQILTAEQSVARSQADVASTRARRLPSLNATLMNFSRSHTGPSVRIQDNPTGQVDPVTGERLFAEETTRIPAVDRNSYSLGAGLTHTLYDGGAQRHTHASARQALAAAELGLRSSQADIVVAVKRRYFGLLRAQELVEVQGEALKLGQRRQEEAEARLEVGASTRVDVLRLQVATDNARADLINAEQQVELARATLNHVIGRPLWEPLQIAPVGADVPSRRYLPAAAGVRVDLRELVSKAQGANSDLERQRRAMRSAELNLKSTQAAWHPTLSGNISYSRNNEIFERVYGGLDENYRLNGGVSLSYNIFDGGLRTAGVRRSRANVEAARLGLEQQERDLALAVETTYLEIVRLARILEIAERTAELAAEDLHLAEERYRVGKGRLLEVLDAQVGLTGARSNRVSTRYDLAVAEAELERLVGEASP